MENLKATDMIRMVQSKSAGHAKAYFSDALSKSDYYVNDQELAGRWQGKLAARLDLDGPATQEAFFALCENRVPPGTGENRQPETGQPLTPRRREDRTTGYDINFHCPKSVSILHVLAGDDHIKQAFEDSVTETMKLIEADSQARVRKGGKSEDRSTGELAWVHFVHQTARPVEGHVPDPHLHSHCFVFNATWDAQEQQFKAAQFRDIKQDMPFYQAHFHKALSDKLMTLGYAIRRTSKSFEVEGVPQKVIDNFSKRTDEIGRIAKEKGITDAKELGELGARTRAKKQKGVSMGELKENWTNQIKSLGLTENNTVRHPDQKETPTLTAQQHVDHAVLHCFERASVMPGRRLLESAYRHSLGNGGVSAAQIKTLFEADKRIIHVKEKGRTLCTTKEVLQEEKRMVDLARQGQGKLEPLYKEPPDISLIGQQAAAVAHVLTTNNRVSIIRGAAGTGKTTLMQEAIEQIEKTGRQVTVVAPSAQASRGVLKDEGFKSADTVAKFLIDEKAQQKLKGQVLWVDEAGLLGTKDMTALLDIATKQNARIILGGDTRQHASVVRGDALRILNTVAGIRSAEVSKIHRQQNEQYKEAVQDLSQGNVADAFKKLDGMGAIKKVDPMKPHDTLVKDYVAALKNDRKAIVISPTHAQGKAVTQAIREALRSEEMIGKKEITIEKLTNKNLTEAEKKDPRNFKEGQIIQFNQNAPSFPRGSAWTVTKATADTITITNAKGETKPLPTAQSHKYDVFTQEQTALSKGDQVRITRNAFDTNNKRLNNGQTLEVVSVKKTDITLQSPTGTKYNIDKTFGHLAHAHVITSHASQGKTVDEVFIFQPASTFPATDAKQFYVSVSRGKHKAHIYTDDKEELLHQASNTRERQSALELTGATDLHKETMTQKQRENYSKPQQQQKSKEREVYGPEI